MEDVKNRDLFECMPVPKAVATMAIPTIVGQLVILIYNMADTFFIGRTGDPFKVAGASLILPIFNTTVALAALAGVGGAAMVSQLLGKYYEDEARKVYSFSMYLSLAIAIIYSLSVFIFMKPLLYLLGAGIETFTYAKNYATYVLVIGGIPTMMANVFASFVRSIGESKKAGFGITFGGVLNIILDPIFMFIILPKGLENVGAGLATAISNYITCIYFIIVIKCLGNKTVLRMTSFKNLPQKKNIIKVFTVGIPALITQLLFDTNYILIDKLMSLHNDIALAAMGIVLKIERLPLNTGVGICQGMVPIVAYNYAAKNYKRMRDVAKFSLFLGICVWAVSVVLYEVFAPNIIKFFINDVTTVELGTRFLRARCIGTLVMFMSFYHVFLFNSYGRGKEAMFLGFSRWVVFNMPVLFFLDIIYGMYGLIWSSLVADSLTTVLSIFIHKRFLKTKM